ncbi:Galactokinase [Caloramator mitchellensis]|uniref:Galactokinase n=1 Tax=Caloramator mitchellensis TaxID=908809 RepID=A0A0R3JVW6_CALMK|nr:Galactokinase [Caloramator mitchellensis]
MDINLLKEEFNNAFGYSNDLNYFFSPGRVNLIGEHIDYNGGLVFPCALSIGIYAAVRYRDDDIVNLRSKNMNNIVSFKLDNIKYDDSDGWGNYPKGVVKYLLDGGYNLKGADVYFVTTLPDGAGLSSSAALEVLTGYLMLYPSLGEKIDRVELAKLCQRVENEFVGVNCGIMDQFSVAMGKKNSAVLLDCNTLEYEYAPLELNDYSLVIMNTNKRRELADSKYNERRSECDKSLEIIGQHKSIRNICEADIDDLKYLNDEVLRKRARHVITENERVKKAVEVLKTGNVEEFGNLLKQSHDSLRDDYEVTGLHLDAIVEEALKFDGCIGARMTGAGFGGCAIALVEKNKIKEFTDFVGKNYLYRTNITPNFYMCSVEDGVKKIG